jgi:hypothetical protein
MSASAAKPVGELFRSFWMAGFESACHINRAGVRLDLIAATEHDAQAADDYRRLAGFGIHTVREAVRWHLVDRGGVYDFGSLDPLAAAARREGVQVIWTLCHYGWPDDVSVLTSDFVGRFSSYAAATTRFLAERSDGPLLVAPVNEISFLAWAAGEEGIMHPGALGMAAPIKRQLVRATIAAIDRIREEAPDTRIVHTEPLVNIVAPSGRPDLAAAAAAETEAQFEAWEMLAGRIAPELGGHSSYLDVLGVNFYHSNQWELGAERLRWEDHPRDGRWIPLHELLRRVWRRYGRPLFIAETSHFGAGRGAWIREVGDEVSRALEHGVPLAGVCVFPAIDRPDWDLPDHWHNSGLWDVRRTPGGALERTLCDEYATALREAQAIVGRSPAAIAEPLPGGQRRPGSHAAEFAARRGPRAST